MYVGGCAPFFNEAREPILPDVDFHEGYGGITCAPLLLGLLVSASTLSAQAENKAYPLAVNNAEASAESEVLMRFQEVKSRLEAVGYKDIELDTDVLVVRGRDESTNSPVVLLVDQETLMNLPIEVNPSTTGSGVR